MNKRRWPEFIRLEVICVLARAQQQVALRRLIEAQEKLAVALQKLADANTLSRSAAKDLKDV